MRDVMAPRIAAQRGGQAPASPDATANDDGYWNQFQDADPQTYQAPSTRGPDGRVLGMPMGGQQAQGQPPPGGWDGYTVPIAGPGFYAPGYGPQGPTSGGPGMDRMPMGGQPQQGQPPASGAGGFQPQPFGGLRKIRMRARNGEEADVDESEVSFFEQAGARRL